MHPYRSTFLAALVCLVGAASVLAQANPRGTATVTLDQATVSVEYGRPSLKGRAVNDLLGKLKPGAFWRLGSDRATTLSTDKDLRFGEAAVPAGQYSLWAQRTESGWNLVFNKQHGQWGTQHDPGQDVASAALKEEKAASSEDMVTLSLSRIASGGQLTIQWGELKLSANFAVK